MNYFKYIFLITFFATSCTTNKNTSENDIAKFSTVSLDSTGNETKLNESFLNAKISGQLFCKGFEGSFLIDEAEKLRFFKNTPCKLRIERIELKDGTAYQTNARASLFKYHIKYHESADIIGNVIDTFESTSENSLKILDKKNNKLKLRKVIHCKYLKNDHKIWDCKGTNEEAYFSLMNINGSLAIEIEEIENNRKNLDIISIESIHVKTYYKNKIVEDKDPPKILKNLINNKYYYTFQPRDSYNFDKTFYLLCPSTNANYNENILSTFDEENNVESFSNDCISLKEGFNLGKYLRSKNDYVILSTVNMDIQNINVNNKKIYLRSYEFPFVKYQLKNSLLN